MTFEEAKDLVYQSDMRNPNINERDEVEAKLISIGFYKEDGTIDRLNFKWDFKFDDGNTLYDLDDWFVNELT